MQKFDETHMLLESMYEDHYYPKFLVDKLKYILMQLVLYLDSGKRKKEEIQEKLDEITIQINNLQEEFYENDSEIETVARDCIAGDVEKILEFFDVEIELEEALRERDW